MYNKVTLGNTNKIQNNTNQNPGKINMYRGFNASESSSDMFCLRVITFDMNSMYTKHESIYGLLLRLASILNKDWQFEKFHRINTDKSYFLKLIEFFLQP